MWGTYRAGTFDRAHKKTTQRNIKNMILQGRTHLQLGPESREHPAAVFSLLYPAFVSFSPILAYLSATLHHSEDAYNRRRRYCGYSPNSPANNQGRRLVVQSPAGNSGVCVWIVHCAAFLVYITKSYFMPLNLYLTTNMISVADTMIVKVHGRPQHARSLTFTCLQHLLCPPTSIRKQNLCITTSYSHFATLTMAIYQFYHYTSSGGPWSVLGHSGASCMSEIDVFLSIWSYIHLRRWYAHVRCEV